MKRNRDTFRRFLARLEARDLLDTFRDTVLRHHRALLADVYGDSKEASSVAARIECFWQLERLSWTEEQIATLFDREKDSVRHALWLLRRESGLQGAVIDDDSIVRLVRTIAEKGRMVARARRVPTSPETGELPPVEKM